MSKTTVVRTDATSVAAPPIRRILSSLRWFASRKYPARLHFMPRNRRLGASVPTRRPAAPRPAPARRGADRRQRSRSTAGGRPECEPSCLFAGDHRSSRCAENTTSVRHNEAGMEYRRATTASALAVLGVVAAAAVATGAGSTRTAAAETTKATRARTPLERLIASGHPLYCGGRRKREVALTFDDGPGPFTFQLLRALRRGHAPATFFLVGNRITRWLSGARAEARYGALGDHTWGHEFLPGLEHGNAVWQIEWGRREIVKRTGVWTSLF